jgi:hypothetical protein
MIDRLKQVLKRVGPLVTRFAKFLLNVVDYLLPTEKKK